MFGTHAAWQQHSNHQWHHFLCLWHCWSLVHSPSHLHLPTSSSNDPTPSPPDPTSFCNSPTSSPHDPPISLINPHLCNSHTPFPCDPPISFYNSHTLVPHEPTPFFNEPTFFCNSHTPFLKLVLYFGSFSSWSHMGVIIPTYLMLCQTSERHFRVHTGNQSEHRALDHINQVLKGFSTRCFTEN